MPTVAFFIADLSLGVFGFSNKNPSLWMTKWMVPCFDPSTDFPSELTHSSILTWFFGRLPGSTCLGMCLVGVLTERLEAGWASVIRILPLFSSPESGIVPCSGILLGATPPMEPTVLVLWRTTIVNISLDLYRSYSMDLLKAHCRPNMNRTRSREPTRPIFALLELSKRESLLIKVNRKTTTMLGKSMMIQLIVSK